MALRVLSITVLMLFHPPIHSRPNILFICTDDQAPWALGHAGNDQAHTPNLDRLFQQGVTLTNSFTTTPVCSPSRAALMTSRYGTELGITDWINPRQEPEVGLDPAWVTWPELLQAAGYETCLVGKWHLGTADRYHPTKAGFDFFQGFRAGGTQVEDATLEIDGVDRKQEGLTVDVLTDYAIEFLEKDHGGKPFLLNLHYRSPHAPWLPVDDEDWAPYKDLDPVIPNPDYPDLDVEFVKEKMREYLASVSGVDRNVGRVLEVLDQAGLAENTIVVFTSDHGYNMGHNGIWHKGNGHWITKFARDLESADPRRQRPNMYDNSLKVPTAIRWPGMTRPGSTLKETIANLDWYPTLLAAAGVDVPEDVPIRGRNFAPLLKGAKIAWDNDFYGEYSQHHYSDTHLRVYRTPEWKLMRDFKREGKDELYNLAEDPAETCNLIDDPKYKDIQESLYGKILAKMKRSGDAVLEEIR
jgi:uncharacterized sulfatase